MWKSIYEIYDKKINEKNYGEKIQDVMEFITQLRADTKVHLGFAIYKFIDNPTLENIDELGMLVRLNNFIIDDIYKELQLALHQGNIDFGDDEESYQKHLDFYRKLWSGEQKAPKDVVGSFIEDMAEFAEKFKKDLEKEEKNDADGDADNDTTRNL